MPTSGIAEYLFLRYIIVDLEELLDSEGGMRSHREVSVVSPSNSLAVNVVVYDWRIDRSCFRNAAEFGMPTSVNVLSLSMSQDPLLNSQS